MKKHSPYLAILLLLLPLLAQADWVEALKNANKVLDIINKNKKEQSQPAPSPTPSPAPTQTSAPPASQAGAETSSPTSTPSEAAKPAPSKPQNTALLSDTKDFGSWVYSKGKDFNDSHFKPKNKFPPTSIGRNDFGITVKLTPVMQDQLVALVQTFKDIYPKPVNESVIFGFDPHEKDGKKSLGYTLHIGEYGFQYDKQGKVKPINYMSQFGRAYDGYARVVINKVESWGGDEAFKTADNLQQLIKGRDFYGLGELVIVVPQNNFALEATKRGVKSTPNAKFGNAADNYFSYRIALLSDAEKYNDAFKEMVVLTYNKQLPVIALTRGQFIELLEMQVSKSKGEIDARQTNESYTTKNKQDDANRWELEKQAVAKLKEINSNSLTKTATILPKHYSLTQLGFHAYTQIQKYPNNYQMYDAAVNVAALQEVFVDDDKLGFTVSGRDKNYYNNMKPDEIRTIAVTWAHNRKVPTSANYGVEDPSVRRNGQTSDVPDTFLNGMLTKFDWDKLASLLSK